MKIVREEEHILIKEIADGKIAGFRNLYELMFNPLCAFGKKYLNDTLLLEDFVQESFIAFWKKRTDFQDINTIKSFLYTSVKNSCLNYLKHQAVQRKNESNIIHSIETDHYFEQAIIEEETFNLLYSEIKNLPESSQKIMLLAMNGLKNPEIANELNISVNTVKTLKKNAYSKLRGSLSANMQQYLSFFFF